MAYQVVTCCTLKTDTITEKRNAASVGGMQAIVIKKTAGLPNKHVCHVDRSGTLWLGVAAKAANNYYSWKTWKQLSITLHTAVGTQS